MIASRISQYMSASPHTIGLHDKLSVAHKFMRENAIRHLPVVDRGQLVGIVSQRDLYFIETLLGSQPEEVTIEEAMTPEPFAVDPEASVERVVREMAAHKYGAVVVMDEGAVVGVFTTTDALKVLADVLADRRRRPPVVRATPARRRAR